jgi:YHS domain-containing protein
MNRKTNKLAKDPLCGMVKPINEFRFSSVYQGKTYYFCTEMDKQVFEAYPDRWLPQESQEDKEEQEGQ